MSPERDDDLKGLAGLRKPAATGRTAPKVAPRSAASAVSAAAASAMYERYKDALRRGHVAALRGRNEAAVDAYGEAASIAPDRALPHASIGGILVKMNRLDDAVLAYERALMLAPRDEASLRGIAETQTRLGRRTAAADALDRLSETLDSVGRLADATDAARRALELAESRDRRAHVEALAERLRTSSPGDEAAERALSQALRLLEPTTEPELPVVEVDDAAIDGAMPAEPTSEPRDEAIAEAEVGQVETVAPDHTDAAEPDAATEPEVAIEPDAVAEAEATSAPEAAAEPEAAIEPEAATEPEVAEPIGLGIALGAVAEAQLYAGELAEAHAGLLAAARAHRRAGRLVAAVDACYLAIGIAPADPDLHLLLAELYLDRGWRSQAADKLLLLDRIATLDEDRTTHERLCELVSARLADEPRVAELCA